MTSDDEREPGRPNPRRLVIADDSMAMRWFVRSAIGDEFGEVIEAADGRELFWALVRCTFGSTVNDRDQVIVTDHVMPTYDGLDVLDAWRDLHPQVLTVLITAYPSATVRRRAEALGAVLLAKPFSTAALRDVIRRHD